MKKWGDKQRQDKIEDWKPVQSVAGTFGCERFFLMTNCFIVIGTTKVFHHIPECDGRVPRSQRCRNSFSTFPPKEGRFVSDSSDRGSNVVRTQSSAQKTLPKPFVFARASLIA